MLRRLSRNRYFIYFPYRPTRLRIFSWDPIYNTQEIRHKNLYLGVFHNIHRHKQPKEYEISQKIVELIITYPENIALLPDEQPVSATASLPVELTTMRQLSNLSYPSHSVESSLCWKFTLPALLGYLSLHDLCTTKTSCFVFYVSGLSGGIQFAPFMQSIWNTLYL